MKRARGPRTGVQQSFELEMSGNMFFNPIPSYSQWLIPIPIPNPKFS